MSKGSGRRRITPSDGLRFNNDTDMTNIEERGASHHQSGGKEIRLGLRTGAQPTSDNRGRRYAGKGRKDDNRNWKNTSKGKQWEHNLVAEEQKADHRPVPANVAGRLRDKSINSDIAQGQPCKVWSRGRSLRLSDIQEATDKFLEKFGRPHHDARFQGEIEKDASQKRSAYHTSLYDRYRSPFNRTRSDLPLMKLGFAIFEEKVKQIEFNLKYGY